MTTTTMTMNDRGVRHRIASLLARAHTYRVDDGLRSARESHRFVRRGVPLRRR